MKRFKTCVLIPGSKDMHTIGLKKSLLSTNKIQMVTFGILVIKNKMRSSIG